MRRNLSALIMVTGVFFLASGNTEGQEKVAPKVVPEKKVVFKDLVVPITWPNEENLFKSPVGDFARGRETSLKSVVRNKETGELEFKLIEPPALRKQYDDTVKKLNLKLTAAQTKLTTAEKVKGEKEREKAVAVAEKAVEKVNDELAQAKDYFDHAVAQTQQGLHDTVEGKVYFAFDTTYIQSGFKPDRKYGGWKLSEAYITLHPTVELRSPGNPDAKVGEKTIVRKVQLKPDRNDDYNAAFSGVTPKVWDENEVRTIVVVYSKK